jgi:hypothetical protein
MPRSLKTPASKTVPKSKRIQDERESKRDRFVRLAEKRTSKALQALRLIANLANRNNYEFTPTDAKKIVGALTREIDGVARRFDDAPAKASSEFKL